MDKLVSMILQDHKPIPQQSSHPHLCTSSVNSSSLSCPHSCPLTPGLAPPSSVVGSSHRVTSSSSCAAPTSCQPQQLPHHLILNKLSVWPHLVSGTVEPAAASKGKCRHEPSPIVIEKKTKAIKDKALHSGISSCCYSCIQLTSYNSDATVSQLSPSCPTTFLKLVQFSSKSILVFIPSLI